MSFKSLQSWGHPPGTRKPREARKVALCGGAPGRQAHSRQVGPVPSLSRTVPGSLQVSSGSLGSLRQIKKLTLPAPGCQPESSSMPVFCMPSPFPGKLGYPRPPGGAPDPLCPFQSRSSWTSTTSCVSPCTSSPGGWCVTGSRTVPRGRTSSTVWRASPTRGLLRQQVSSRAPPQMWVQQNPVPGPPSLPLS